jgi:PTH1 family peptidyl-tRNA hydrolase
MKPIALIGLGNPGSRYSANRHNAGYLFMDYLSGSKNSFDDCGSFVMRKIRFGQESLYLCKPKTYMNESGIAARAVVGKFGILPSELLICYDDFSIVFGSIRLRKGGSDGGHNGIADVMDTLGTIEIPRLRIGIGPVPDDQDVA